MINEYCGSLDTFFSLAAYYGLLSERDAQCFRVESLVQEGAYVLATAAVMLALLNTFVMKATAQYFRDVESRTACAAHAIEAGDFIEHDQITSEIKPTPVLFTDTFRWLLVRQNPVSSESASLKESCAIQSIVSSEDRSLHSGVIESVAQPSINDDNLSQGSFLMEQHSTSRCNTEIQEYDPRSPRWNDGSESEY
jgi:hypothetical protein